MATKKKPLPKAQTIGQTGPKFKTSIPSQTKRYSVSNDWNPFGSTNVGPVNTTGPRENAKKKGGSVKSKSKKK